jgi:hypothetical protein
MYPIFSLSDVFGLLRHRERQRRCGRGLLTLLRHRNCTIELNDANLRQRRQMIRLFIACSG